MQIKRDEYVIGGLIVVFISLLAIFASQLPKQPKNESNATERAALITSVPTVMVPSTAPTVTYPAQILNLINWKIAVPIGASEKPTEIKQPKLATYMLDPWFVITDASDGVRFRAPVSAVTTVGSHYPRSELREMTKNGTENASWSSDKGVHTLFIDQAITAVPEFKKHVVAGQIHDDSDDILVIRLEYPTLYVNVGGENLAVLDETYTLGKRFTIKIVVQNGKTDVYYNGSKNSSYTLNKIYTDSYFKAGVYTQSNCSRENSQSLCRDNNYGEVIVYQVTVEQQ